MAVYLIVDELGISDEGKLKEYLASAGALLKASGGKLLASAVPHVLEGDWKPKKVVLIEFPDQETLDRFWTSPEYRELAKVRQAVSDNNIITVESP
jgi:uncharacterized protein (DUF1330 family)